MKLTQEEGDKLVIITEGKYAGHEGIVRSLENGEVAVLVLEKNEKRTGPVKVIDVVKFVATVTEEPSIH